MNYITQEKGLTQIIVNITFPLHSPEQVLRPLEDAIKGNPGIKVASLDHISSYPATTLPIKEMVKLCRDAGIFVLVDGAHALGQIPLDVTDIGASAYITNAHKWCYNPKSACILHVEKKWQPFILPNIISSEFTGGFSEKFQYTGTINYNSFLATMASMDFRESIGGDSAIMNYIHNLAWNSGNKVAEIWGTSLVVTNETMVPAMSLVVLPTEDPSVIGHVRSVLADKYDTWIQTGAVETTDGKNTQYIRISAQVYLEESDLVLMAERFLAIMNEFLAFHQK
jgi:selenocysteine lyase/cysteine desulfurase